MPRARLVLQLLVLALPLLGVAVTSPTITIGTCGEQVERMRVSFEDLQARVEQLHVQREDWPLPVSSAGQPMFGAERGVILHGPPSADAWPELARDVAKIEASREMMAPRREPTALYLALRRDVPLDKHWPALRRLAAEWELRLVVAAPEPALPLPVPPTWMREALAGRVLTSQAGFDRLDELRDVWQAADRCPASVRECTAFGWRPVNMLWHWHSRASACGCFMFDEDAMIALAWRAFAPQGPPQRWLRLKIAVTDGEQRRAEQEYGLPSTEPESPTALLLPGSATVDQVVSLLSHEPRMIIHVGAPKRGPLFNPLADYAAWAHGGKRRGR